MKLRCTIGSQGFAGGHTYLFGEIYEMDNDELAQKLIEQGYAEEIQKEVSGSPVVSSPILLEKNKDIPAKIENKQYKRTNIKRK